MRFVWPILVVCGISLLLVSRAAGASSAASDNRADQQQNAENAPESVGVWVPVDQQHRDDDSDDGSKPVASDTEESRQDRDNDAPLPHGGWFLGMAGGAQTLTSANIEWFDAPTRSEVSTWLDVGFGRLTGVAPGMGLRIGYARRAGSGRRFAFGIDGVHVGLLYDIPPNGIMDAFFPYVRASFLGHWAQFDLAEAGEASRFIPGVGGALGLRLALPRVNEKETSRLFLMAEWGYDHFSTTEVNLQRSDAGINRRPTPLGTLNLSGYSWRIGGGIQF